MIEKGREKITFCVILLGEKRRVKTNGAQVFYSQACQNIFSPNWGEMWRENENTKMSSILDIPIPVQHCFFFFFFFIVSLLDYILQEVSPT